MEGMIGRGSGKGGGKQVCHPTSPPLTVHRHSRSAKLVVPSHNCEILAIPTAWFRALVRPCCQREGMGGNEGCKTMRFVFLVCLFVGKGESKEAWYTGGPVGLAFLISKAWCFVPVPDHPCQSHVYCASLRAG